MLSNFANIFEKIIKSILINYLEKNKLLSRNQFGLRRNLGTENALYSATSFIYNAIDNGKKVTVIFLDLEKAFDTVDCEGILNILPNVGIHSFSLTWFKNYLSNRKQRVKINENMGYEMITNFGVSQGSALGAIYIYVYGM